MNKFIRMFVAVVVAMFVALGVVTPAQAAVEASFSAVATAEAQATATAVAVAWGTSNARGRVFLQEEAVTIPQDVKQRLWRAPTAAEMQQYGTTTSGREAAQAAVTREVGAYKAQIASQRASIQRAYYKARYWKKHHKPAKAKKWRMTAKKRTAKLETMLVSWQYRPLVRITNLCFLNRGMDGQLNAVPYSHCLGADGLWIGYDPVTDVMRIVWFGSPGSGSEGCLNQIEFDIPPDVISANVVILLRTLVGVKLNVSVQVAVTVHLTVTGEMRNNGVVCDTESQTVTRTKTVTMPAEEVEETDADQAMRIAEERVRVRLRVDASVQNSVAAQVTEEVGAEMHLSCDATPSPSLVSKDTVNDVLVNNTRTVSVTGVVPTGYSGTLYASAGNGGSITVGAIQSVTGSFTTQITYKAPSEVPGANGAIPAGRDQVNFSLVLNDGQTARISTNMFEIRVAPTPPM